MPADWPFDDSRNVAVFTTGAVYRRGEPILYVSHDEDDGAWQFHNGGQVSTADMMIVALEEVFVHDPSIGELFDLPYGWCAIRRAVGQPWARHDKSAA